MLDQIGKIYNQLSPELRTELEKMAADAGPIVKFKFAIAKLNPDGERKADGEYLYPLRWSLTPIIYDITDPYDRKRKRIALVKNLKELGAPHDSFRRVHLDEQWRGILKLDMSNHEDQDTFCYLMLHPKFEGGKFRDNNVPGIFSRVDEVRDAKTSLSARENKAQAMFVASQMSANEVADFACAMNWNEHEDMSILRDRVMGIAEGDPEFFKTFINNKSIEYRATIKRAIDNNIIAFQPVESKFVWVSNGQTIAILDRCEGNKVLDRMSDWVVTSKNGMEVYNKIKLMLKAPVFSK